MPKLREVKKWEQFWCWTALWECVHRWRLLYDKCQCECWTIKFVHHDHLIHWRTTNCWCKMYEVRSKNGKMNKRHGMEWTRPYKIFMSAKWRCNNKNNNRYYRYWWRWIKMEWNSIEEFWKDMWKSYYKHIKQYWENNTTLDRIDVNWNYCKNNCRRATREEQMNNMSTNHKVIYRWKEYNSISMLCKTTKTRYWLVRDRIRLGWSIEDAIEKPLIQSKSYVRKNKIQLSPLDTHIERLS